MINNLQLLRAVAALCVVFYHNRYMLNGTNTSFQGVAIFFVISGFIMTYITRNSAENFYLKRLIRIVPLYWVCTLLFVVCTNLGLTNPVVQIPILVSWLFEAPLNIIKWLLGQNGLTHIKEISAFLGSIFFIPYQNEQGEFYPLLGVGWTLNLEMFFYSLFAISLRVSHRYAPILVSSILIAIIFISRQEWQTAKVLNFYGHATVMYFIAGVMSYYVWIWLSPIVRNEHTNFVLILSLFVVVAWILLNLRIGYGVAEKHRFSLVVYLTISWLMPVFLVFFALILHTLNLTFLSRNVILLGEASYSLYLTHPFVLEIFRTTADHFIWFDSRSNLLVVFVTMAMSVSLAIFIHKRVEIPLIRTLQNQFLRNRG